MARAADKRRKKKERKQQLEEQVQQAIKVKSPREQISEAPDESLFFIDEQRDETQLSGLKRAKKVEKKSEKSILKTPKSKFLSKAIAKEKASKATKVPADAVYDLWGGDTREPARTKQYRNKTIIEPAGCSYNPAFEDHQDAVAEIVATENRKTLITSAKAITTDVQDVEGGGKRRKKPSEVSDQRFVSVKKTMKQIRREERELKEKLERRRIEAEEKKKVLPPRLGKHRFKPELNHVLTTEEVDGSIRNLKSAPGLAGTMFNKLQRKGLIEPRTKAIKRRRRRYVVA